LACDGEQGARDAGKARDEGKEYDHSEWTPPDLNDRATRRRGRGLGWQIIYSAMNQVVLLPKTPAGNLTLLLFDPAKITI